MNSHLPIQKFQWKSFQLRRKYTKALGHVFAFSIYEGSTLRGEEKRYSYKGFHQYTSTFNRFVCFQLSHFLTASSWLDLGGLGEAAST